MQTNEETVEKPTRTKYRSSLARKFDAAISAMKDHLSNGDLADLRRNAGLSPAFWKLYLAYFSKNEEESLPTEYYEKIATCLSGIARAYFLHSPAVSVGLALSRAQVSERRVIAFLSARGTAKNAAYRSMISLLLSSGQAVDLSELASIYMSASTRNQKLRIRCAQDFFRGEYKKEQGE